MKLTDPSSGNTGTPTAACQCVWVCGRGRTLLSCDMRCHDEDDIEVRVTRNGRLYGTYRFGGKLDAATFATRLRHSFEGNGWIADSSLAAQVA